MKIIIRDDKIVGSATDEYTGPDEFIQLPESDEFLILDHYTLVDGELVYKKPVPQEVTMGQCRLALFDHYEIESDEDFLALTDALPEDQRARARLELRTRTTVRRDSPLVIGLGAAKGWDLDELFTYAATL